MSIQYESELTFTGERSPSRLRPTVFLVTSNYWRGIEYQRHHFARRFAEIGCPVVFIERTPQRGVRHPCKDLWAWLKRRGQGSKDKLGSPPPPGVSVVSPRWLPPGIGGSALARMLVRRTMRPFKCYRKRCIVITYVPTDNALALIDWADPLVSAYICVHNYDAVDAPAALVDAERRVIARSDVLLTDTQFLNQRIRRLSGRSDVGFSPPGVEFERFAAAGRGDEHIDARKVLYFGGVGPHMDFGLYEEVVKLGYELTFAGVVNSEAEKLLPSGARRLPPVSNCDLPDLIRDYDILMLAYRRSDYMDGVIPAKFFECLATGKPVLVSGLEEARPYADVVYDLAGSRSELRRVLGELPRIESETRKQRQLSVAKSADWSLRFHDLAEVLNCAMQRNSRG